MATKSVLVSFMERKKIVKIDVEKQMSDVEFLSQEFRKEFCFESNVNVVVTFQRFDPEWGEYVDLEPDSVLNHKDKLLAVVTPILVTPSASSCEEEYTEVSPLCRYVQVSYPSTTCM